MNTVLSNSNLTYYVYSFTEVIEGQKMTDQYALKKPLKKNESADEGYFAYSNSDNILEKINKAEAANSVLNSDTIYVDATKTEYTAKEIKNRFHRVEIDHDDLVIRTHSPKGLVNFVFFPKD